MGKCKWCGDVTDARKMLCRSCKDMRTYYNYRIARLFHSTPLGELIKFRNACMDMINFREHGGKDLPHDLDYQLDRANRYIDEVSCK